MKIKRYFSTDMRKALRQVRIEQGPDAVILSSRRVRGGIEIVAAVDYDQDLIAEMMQADPGREAAPERRVVPERVQPVERKVASAPEAEPVAARAKPDAAKGAKSERKDILWSPDPAIVEMRRELSGMRDLLESQIEQLTWTNMERHDPVRALMIKRLGKIGIARDFADVVLKGVRNLSDIDNAWRGTLYALAQRLPVCDEEIVDHGGVVALVGPTGVGKTTTIAKLAARFALRHGRQNLALITTDTCRVGAHRQLATFGQILGVPVHLAQSGRELADLVREASGKRLVLVDTAGMSQRDVRLAEQFESLKATPRLRSYLVLSANIQCTALDEAVRRYAPLKPTGCVLTKIDEATLLGDALTAIARHGLPLAYVSEGQRVPEDIALARSTRLVSRAVALAGEDGLHSGHEPAAVLAASPTEKGRVTGYANLT